MKLTPFLLLAACVATLAGCATHEHATDVVRDPAAPTWRFIATENDRERLREWRSAWTEGLAKAAAAGHNEMLGQEGALLDPDAALPWQTLPPGDYRCRTIKVGGKTKGMLDYVAYPAFQCRIQPDSNGRLTFAKLTGSQRPMGLILPYTGERMVFLGTLQLGDETRSLQYGVDRDRDMAGLLEKIGDNRWRLVFPYPHFESTIDVMELVPDGSAS